MTSECDHAPSDNPRYANSCRKCGRVIPKPQVEARNPEFERQLTREMAVGLNVDVEPLIAMAEWRADQGEREYGHDFPPPDRNLEHETAEELCDARNYLVWNLERIHRAKDDSADTQALQRALRHVVLAFDALRHAL